MSKPSFLLMCLLGVVLASGMPAAAALADLSDKRIFLLYSYHPTFPTSDKVLAGIRSVFADTAAVIDIEYMDSKRLHDAASQENFLTMLRYKLARRDRYNLVITADDNALAFMLAHGETLFPGVPVVFLGVNDITKALQQDENPLFTGIIEASSFRETIALARELQPTRDRIHIVVDGTTSGQADLQSVLALRDQFADTTFVVHSLTNFSWEEYADQLRNLDGRDLILLLSAYRDRYDTGKSFSDSLALIKANTAVPIYHLWEHGMGDGVLGGVIISHREQGRQAALMARQILTGQPVADIPVISKSPNLPIFDSRELTRYAIDESMLPANTVVRFRPDSVFNRYQYEIIAFLLIVTFLTGLSLYLSRQNAKLAKLTNDLSEKSSFLRLLMNTIPDLVWMKDPDGVYQSCNARFESFFDATEQDIIGKTDFDFVDEDLAQFFRNNDLRAIEKGKPCSNEERIVFADDGHEELLETVKTPVFDDEGLLLGVLGVGRDITQRRLAEAQIRTLSQALEQSPVSVMITDADGNIEYVNQSFERVTGYTREEVCGRNPRFLQSGNTPAESFEALWQSLSTGQAWEGEFQNRKKNGNLFWEYAHIAPVYDDAGNIGRYLGVSEDITLRKKQREKILLQAHFDALTRLPNRLLSLDRLTQLMARQGRTHEKTAVLFIDLDDFKKINDSLGHNTGDKLLIEAAKRLQQGVREQDTVGRLGGDEFIVLLGGLGHAADAGPVAGELLKRLETPFVIEDKELLLSASIGIATHPDDGDNVTELLRKADTAMYYAKGRGRADYAFFTPELNLDVSRRFTLEQHMTGALDRGEFHLHYQPQIDIKSGRIVGLEALLRWHNPTLGKVPPSEFIPIAEQNGSIVALGRFVLQKSLVETAHWHRRFGPSFTLAVNLSPRQFRDKGLIDFVDRALSATSLPASALEFEITEGVLMEQHADIGVTLSALSQKGINLAMDDFGTGYSSLSYLRKYPFDILKIDRSFTCDITSDPADRELVFATIAMAHGLGLTVVAEGVETQEQLALLEDQCCDLAQGYLYGQPVRANRLTEVLGHQMASNAG